MGTVQCNSGEWCIGFGDWALETVIFFHTSFLEQCIFFWEISKLIPAFALGFVCLDVNKKKIWFKV